MLTNGTGNPLSEPAGTAGEPQGTWAWAEAETTPVDNAGTQTHTANFTPEDATNYNLKNAVSVTVAVGKQVATPPVIVEKPNTPTVTGNPSDGETMFAYAPKDDPNRYTTEVPTESGDYTVGVYVYPTDNYNDAWALADFTIAKAPIASVEVAGIDEPEADGALDTTATTSTAGVTLDEVA